MLEQGGILLDFPVFQPLEFPDIVEGEEIEVDSPSEDFDLITLTQTCDLLRWKSPQIVFAQIVSIDEMELINDRLKTDRGKEEVRRGLIPSLYMLPESDVPGFESDIRVVNFHRTYALYREYVKTFILRNPKRLRLMTPFREQMSQSFARFFMRVGTPSIIPRFMDDF